MPRSAGILLYRRRGAALEVLLVHPGGPYWARRDDGAWTIPKGELAAGEAPLDAARREFEEETGIAVDGAFVALSPVRQKGRKEVVAFALEGDADAGAIRSNTFRLEWPPRSGRVREYPEVDRAEWFPLAQAAEKLHPAQVVWLAEIAALAAS
jgi:predicted NUDIX family NTP pyrophosphohydrolase